MFMRVLYVFSGRFMEALNGKRRVDRHSRQDFLVIPFQAVEVYLDSIVPAEGEL